MKQEIYVKIVPKSCLECKFFTQDRRRCEIKLGVEWSEERQRYNDCPIKPIKNHYKELVAKVLEEIKLKFSYYELLVDEIKEKIDFNKIKNDVLDQIQRGFKDE